WVGEVRATEAARVRHRDGHQPAYLPGVHDGQGPRDEAAQALADDDGVAVAQRADDPRGVLGEGPRVVAARRLVARAEAAQVHGGDPVAGAGEGRQAGPAPPPQL